MTTLTIDGLTPAAEIHALEPTLSLAFYPFGVILRRQENGEAVEYAVDPAAISEALASSYRFETGLLGANTLYVSQEGVRQVVIEYRPPERVGLWVEDRDEPYRIPFPGLILCRRTGDRRQAQYRVYAVQERPLDLSAKLFRAPLPNTDDGICWGSVTRTASGKGIDLKSGWDALLGSKFNSHGVYGKSERYSSDVRQMYRHLERYRNKQYPLDDLVGAKRTLKKLIEDLNT